MQQRAIANHPIRETVQHFMSRELASGRMYVAELVCVAAVLASAVGTLMDVIDVRMFPILLLLALTAYVLARLQAPTLVDPETHHRVSSYINEMVVFEAQDINIEDGARFVPLDVLSNRTSGSRFGLWSSNDAPVDRRAFEGGPAIVSAQGGTFTVCFHPMQLPAGASPQHAARCIMNLFRKTNE